MVLKKVWKNVQCCLMLCAFGFAQRQMTAPSKAQDCSS